MSLQKMFADMFTGTKGTIVKGALTAVAMFAFGFAMVPLYNVFCKVTGLNGKTDNVAYQYRAETARVDESRTITIQFLATNNQGINWDFKPSVSSIKVHPGEIGSLSFRIKNPTGKKVIAQAIPSVTPFAGTDFLHKTECFCFTTQPLQAGEEKDMPLKIIIDPELPKYIRKLTLSYTLFDVTDMYKSGTAGL